MARIGHTQVYNQTAAIIREKVDEARETFAAAGADVEAAGLANFRIEVLRELADRFAGEYQADNVNFNHDRFMGACGFEVKR